MEHPKNPNKHEDRQIEALAKIINHQGWRNPIVVSSRSGFVIAGHGRLMAAKKLGAESVPVDIQEFENEATEYAHMIADNKIAEFAEMDDLVISGLVSELGEDFDLELAGLLDGLNVEILEDNDSDEGDFDAEPPKEPKTKRGDKWQLGDHFLFCGDSTKHMDVEKLVGKGEKADMLITDPPYNVDYEGGTKEKLKIQNDSMANDDFLKFLNAAFDQGFEFLKPGGSFYIWHADSEGFNFRYAVFLSGQQVRQNLVWAKSSLVMGRQDYQWKHEPCLYGWKEGAGHYWGNDRKQTTILEFDKPVKNSEHPTMKPVELFKYQIQNSSKKGERIMDLFGGSGTTLIACEELQRKALIMELEEGYCDVIINRWEQHTGKTAKLVK